MSAKGVLPSPKTEKEKNILYKWEIPHQHFPQFPQGEKGILSQGDKNSVDTKF